MHVIMWNTKHDINTTNRWATVENEEWKEANTFINTGYLRVVKLWVFPHTWWLSLDKATMDIYQICRMRELAKCKHWKKSHKR